MTKFPGCQLAGEFKGASLVFPLIVEPKYDGYRLNAVVDAAGDVTFYCRDGEPVMWGENLGHIAVAIQCAGVRSVMLDGEVLAKSWNRTSSLLRSKRAGMSDAAKAAIVDEVRFAVFDLVDLTLEPRMLKSGPRARKLCSVFAVSLTERRSRLMDLDLEPPLFLAPQTVVSSLAELHEEYEHLLEFGFEGAIVKEPSAYYWPGERGCGWWKMKPSQTMELVIIRCEPGAGKHEGRLGAIVGRRADGVEIAVGTGLTDSQREEFWARREALVGMEMEIKAQAGDVASARHPVFVRIREEKARGRA